MWVEDRILGRAPQEVDVPESGEVNLRVAMPGCQDWQRRFSASELVPGKTYRVELLPLERVTARFRSTPTGATVFVNGEQRGTTPLLVGDLAPGHVVVRFTMPGRETIERTLELKPGDETQTVTVSLPNLTEQVYQQRIERNPNDLGNYADLAHYLTLQHEFEAAAKALATAAKLYSEGTAREGAKRLFQEMKRIPSRQFDYGGKEAVMAARRAIGNELLALVEELPKPNSQIYQNLIPVLLQSGRRDEAIEVTKQALILHPKDKHILGFQKKLGIELDPEDVEE